MKKEDLSRSLAASFDMPDELMTKMPHITITGNHSVLVENHGGIRSFSAEKVCIGSSCGTIVLGGTGLELRLLKKDELEAEGTIFMVRFEEERAEKR